jgi:hypothetical protein
MTAETVGLRSNPRQSILTLSAVGELLHEADRSPAARIEDLLELEHRARVLGDRDLAAWYADRIVDEMLGGVA